MRSVAVKIAGLFTASRDGLSLAAAAGCTAGRVRTRWLKFTGLMCGIVLGAPFVAPAHAANINMTATGCQTTFAPSEQLIHVAWGVTTWDTTETPQMVTCTLPRAPLQFSSASGGFYVDGDNVNGASTSCTLFSFNRNGDLAGAASFQTSAPQYDVLLSLAAGQLSDLGHTTLRCLLPAHAGGTLLGVTSLQPLIAASNNFSVNTSTVACQPIGAASTDIRHVENGTYTEGTVTGPRMVTCAIPRMPLAFFATGSSFLVTGDNRGGATSTCTLTAYQFTGDFVGSSSFTTSAGHYAESLAMTAAQLPYWAYASLTCLLPDGARGDIESVVAFSPAAPAGNINTNATECQAQSWPQDAILHTDQGIATASTTSSDTWVACAVPRSPLAAGVTSGLFYVDGDSFNGAWTVCSLASYNYTGEFLGSIGFNNSGQRYDVPLILPLAQLGTWAYTGLTCILPAHANAILRGVASSQ